MLCYTHTDIEDSQPGLLKVLVVVPGGVARVSLLLINFAKTVFNVL